VSIESDRDAGVRNTLARIKSIVGDRAVDRSALQAVLEQLCDLAWHRDWWSASAYPSPVEGALHARYLISEDADKTFALYLNVMRPGNQIAPHNHTTWAVIAAIEGSEFDHLYARTDDGARAGHSVLQGNGTVEVAPGSGIALLPDDIHAVEIRGSEPIRHLHLYGRSLETLTERIRFDLEKQTYERMPIGVATHRQEPVNGIRG
jgi:predicted metal-dependent enzyme (double-stranded beta helix superfamily)